VQRDHNVTTWARLPLLTDLAQTWHSD